MLSLSTALTKALGRPHVDLVHYVRLETKAGAVFEFTDLPFLTYAPSLGRISPLGQEMNPLTRKTRIGQATIQMPGDGYFRDLVVAHRMKGAAVNIKMGAASLTTVADFAARFVGGVDKVQPHADGSYDLVCLDALSIVQDVEIVGYWINKHPLEIISDILLNKVGLPASLVDSTSLDPTAYGSSISHWCVSRGANKSMYEDMSVNKPTSALKLVDELAAIINGHIVCGEDGKVRFALFQTTGLSPAVWTEDDFWDLRLESLDDNAVNEVVVNYNKVRGEIENVAADPPTRGVYRVKDTAAAANAAYPGTSERVFTHAIDTPWIEGEGNVYSVNGSVGANMTAGSPAVGQSFELLGYTVHGMCGTRWPGFPSGSQPATAALSAGRSAYIQIDSEIIECDLTTISTTLGSQTIVLNDPSTGAQVDAGKAPVVVGFRVKTRGAMGTTAAAHTCGLIGVASNPAVAFDVTIPVMVADVIIKRFGEGAPVLKLRTLLDKYAYQIGDTVSPVSSRLKWYGRSSGLTTDDVFEIVGKEVLTHENEPCIEWTLCWATKGTPRSTTMVAVPRDRGHQMSIAAATAIANSLSFKPKFTGMAAVVVSGLDIEVGSGSAQLGINEGRLGITVSRTLPATKDNYISYDHATNKVIVRSQTIGDPEPTLPGNEYLIRKMTTDGTGVTADEDRRNTVDAIVDEKVTSKSVKALAIGARQTNNDQELGKFLNLNATFGHWSQG